MVSQIHNNELIQHTKINVAFNYLKSFHKINEDVIMYDLIHIITGKTFSEMLSPFF